MRLSRTNTCLAIGALLMAGCQADGPSFRDLNGNGQLDPYEDARLPALVRANDLLARMTLEEKVGTMLHGTLASDDLFGISGAAYDLEDARKTIHGHHVTTLLTRLEVDARTLAQQNNALQRLAEQTRLGIPLTISTDPRNHFKRAAGESAAPSDTSQWPEATGFGALGDADTVRQFADHARQEYRALGIHMALSPVADLFTEPRWSRGTSTFGSDPELVSPLVGAYVEGFQGGQSGINADGVAAVVKHWVGYGALPDGFDSLNYYGRNAWHDNASFARHVAAFDGAFAANVAGVMPTYAIINGVTLDGEPLEAVGANFNRQLLTDLLRRDKGFSGLVVSDWNVTDDCNERCQSPTPEHPQRYEDFATPWGAEQLTEVERFAKVVNAGVDQIGGLNDPSALLEAVATGLISQARVDEAVLRGLVLKFELGLFDRPYVDEDDAVRVAANPQAHAAGLRAQAQAQVILENRLAILPLQTASKLWLYGMDAATAGEYGFQVVENLAAADVAIVRAASPFETLHPWHAIGSVQQEGRLDFRDGDEAYEAVKQAAAAVPTVVVVDLFRPAVLTNVRERVQGLVASFGSSDGAVLDVLTGKIEAKGRLPFELPSSMQAVERQNPALPDDSENPLYPAGYRAARQAAMRVRQAGSARAGAPRCNWCRRPERIAECRRRGRVVVADGVRPCSRHAAASALPRSNAHSPSKSGRMPCCGWSASVAGGSAVNRMASQAATVRASGCRSTAAKGVSGMASRETDSPFSAVASFRHGSGCASSASPSGCRRMPLAQPFSSSCHQPSLASPGAGSSAQAAWVSSCSRANHAAASGRCAAGMNASAIAHSGQRSRHLMTNSCAGACASARISDAPIIDPDRRFGGNGCHPDAGGQAAGLASSVGSTTSTSAPQLRGSSSSG